MLSNTRCSCCGCRVSFKRLHELSMISTEHNDLVVCEICKN